ncbi:uncharacterized protein N7482_008750 [Penicillium canariense]|uniref:Zn(2)-C6 fungal-type domain-containing protein n=1 Tax=Penicillium canariense TaxID=189055 RepID=A0A9W9HWV5_9EURO|nr:uncharacterized protein N7482_008750 [Penicillium canariense]KAJ5157650.1 hypothetical protein N7482_008750 [Penicillium canariense]
MPRRAHTKSRYGCDHCRRRRVKCDEQGPPCTNCIVRQLEGCTYSRVVPACISANARRPSQDTIQTNTVVPGALVGPYGATLGVDELELMHQFATETYHSLCVSESEQITWQKHVPRLALKHRYLMHGIMALASLHIATTLEPQKARVYIDAGLEYHNMSLEPFRNAIDNLTPEKYDAVLAESVVTTAISLALPQLTATNDSVGKMIENIITAFELLQGVKKILTIGQPWIHLQLFSQGEFWKDTSAELDDDTDSALDQLLSLNEQIRLNGDETQYIINRDVINHLRHCFMKFACSSDPAPVLAWLAAVDNAYVHSIRRRSPFALLILAHWGLLLGELGEKRWWARDSGQALISELLDALTTEDLLWENCLGWVRRKLSLQSVQVKGNASIENLGSV